MQQTKVLKISNPSGTNCPWFGTILQGALYRVDNMNNTDFTLERSIVDDKDFIKNIYQYYQHDLSEFNDSLQLGSTGLFDNSFVDSYYSEDNLIPLKITLENSVVGFIFCSLGQKVDYIIQDMFILRNYRNRGLGKLALKQLFGLYPGKYGLDILKKNETAKSFWAHCLERLGITYTSYKVIEDGEPGIRFIFDSGKPFHPMMKKNRGDQETTLVSVRRRPSFLLRVVTSPGLFPAIL